MRYAKRKSDPYRRGVSWWKIKNRAYTQPEGRHELFNGAKHRISVKRTHTVAGRFIAAPTVVGE